MMQAKSSPKLGIVGHGPVVPLMPRHAQLALAYHGTLHVKFDDSDAYVSTTLPSIPPARLKDVVTAIKACSTELTWSGSGSSYYHLTVVPDEAMGRARLLAGTTLIGYVFVVAGTDIVSGDEPVGQQIEDGETDTDGDDEGDSLN